MKAINKHGFSLAELLIVLALLAVILVAGISFYLFPNKVFDNIIVRTNLEYGVKDILMKMAADIRSATKPDLVTNAIVIYNTDGDVATSGNRIDIYSYNDNEMYYKYNKVSYKYEDGFLLRGSINGDTASNIKTAIVNNYYIIRSGIIYPSEGELFEDITVNSAENDIRTISINLIAKDETKKFMTSQERPLIITSRLKSSH